jgi:hypothetical protein
LNQPQKHQRDHEVHRDEQKLPKGREEKWSARALDGLEHSSILDAHSVPVCLEALVQGLSQAGVNERVSRVDFSTSLLI